MGKMTPFHPSNDKISVHEATSFTWWWRRRLISLLPSKGITWIICYFGFVSPLFIYGCFWYSILAGLIEILSSVIIGTNEVCYFVRYLIVQELLRWVFCLYIWLVLLLSGFVNLDYSGVQEVSFWNALIFLLRSLHLLWIWFTSSTYAPRSNTYPLRSCLQSLQKYPWYIFCG